MRTLILAALLAALLSPVAASSQEAGSFEPVQRDPLGTRLSTARRPIP